jgi:hypothetical protein
LAEVVLEARREAIKRATAVPVVSTIDFQGSDFQAPRPVHFCKKA